MTIMLPHNLERFAQMVVTKEEERDPSKIKNGKPPYGEAWSALGYKTKCPSQVAYGIMKKRPEIRERIEEIRRERIEDARKASAMEKEEYIQWLESIVKATGEFTDADLKHRLDAAKMSMKSLGYEGVNKHEISGDGGIQIVLNKNIPEE